MSFARSTPSLMYTRAGGAKLLVVALAGFVCLAQPVFAVEVPGYIFELQREESAVLPPIDSEVSYSETETKRLKSQVRFRLTKLVISGATLIDRGTLKEAVTPFLGKEVGLTDIYDAIDVVSLLYRQQGFSLAYAYLPPQRIEGGVVTINVVEPVYGEIKTVSEDQIRPYLLDQVEFPDAGDSVNLPSLERSLSLLNNLNGIAVGGQLSAGSLQKTTDLSLTMLPQDQTSTRLGFSNFGSESTGRIIGDVVWMSTNPFGLGQAFTFSTQLSNTSNLLGWGFGYASPYFGHGWRSELSLSSTRYQLGGEFASLGYEGDAEAFEAAVTYPIDLTSERKTQFFVGVATARSRIASELSSLETDVVQSISTGFEISAKSGAAFDYSGRLNVERGTASFEDNQRKTVEPAGLNRLGEYWLGAYDMRFNYAFSPRQTLSLNVDGQLASRNLIPAKKKYFGGPNRFRASASGSLGADSGTLVTLNYGINGTFERFGSSKTELFIQSLEFSPNKFALDESGLKQSNLVGIGAQYTLQTANNIKLQVGIAGPLNSTAKRLGSNEFWSRIEYVF